MYHRRRILRLMLWLSKHRVILFRKEIFKSENWCLAKPRVTSWRSWFNCPSTQLDRPSWGNPTSAVVPSKTIEDEVDDWRKSMVTYLQDPKGTSDRKSNSRCLNLF
jgi:hypothetical protein